MTGRAPDVLPIALRAWAVPELPVEEPWISSRTRADPELMLVFDTETRLEPEQALTFGFGRIYRRRLRVVADAPDDWECIGEWLFYGEDLTAEETDVLEAFAYRGPTVEYFGSYNSALSGGMIWREHRLHIAPDGVPIVVLPRARFVHSVLWPVLRDGGMLVGFNLPFDIARVAEGWGTARPSRRRKAAKPWDPFAGGFSLPLLADRAGRPNRKGPRIVIHTIDSKRHLIALRGHAQTMYRGHFLDLRTLVFALTNQGYRLATAAEAFETAHRKMDHAPTGRVDEEELVYGRADVQATFDLAVALLEEFGRHAVIGRSNGSRPVDLQPTKAFSPASIGKGYLRAFGIEPMRRHTLAERPRRLGQWMSAFYGGRAECHIRRTIVPVVYVDYTAMYPTVCLLLDLWGLLTAETVRFVDVTTEVQAFLDTVELDDLFEPQTWRRLAVLVELEPDGAILPVRAAYEDPVPGWQIGVNPLSAERPLHYALPDVVASKVLGGRTPRIRRAVRLEWSGRQADLRPVSLRGEVVIDPRSENFFAAVIERRASLTDKATPLGDFLKVLANASSYGIFAEMVTHPLTQGQRVPVVIYDAAGRRVRDDLPWVEEPGEFAYPPMAALITSGARLALACLEALVTAKGGSYLMVDTDSMAIVATETGGPIPCAGGPSRTADGHEAVHSLSWAEVEDIRATVNRLNPYAPGTVDDVLKLEDVNFAADPTPDQPNRVDRGRRVQLFGYGISAKRYALFELTANVPVMRKVSEHGLGHLLNPDDPDDRQGRAWIERVWRNLIATELGQEPEALGFEDRPAVTRIGVSTPALLRPFEGFNLHRPAHRRIRPFNFLLGAHVAPLGQPPGVDPRRFHLIARYETNPQQWTKLAWIDRYSKPLRRYRITTTAPHGEDVQVHSIGSVLAAYATHPEPKSLGPDGEPCHRLTVGLLHRRPVEVGTITYIGKEANAVEEVESGLVHDLDEVQLDYGPHGEDDWEEIRRELWDIPTAALVELTGVDRRTIQRTKRGQTRPRAETLDLLRRVVLSRRRARKVALGPNSAANGHTDHG